MFGGVLGRVRKSVMDIDKWTSCIAAVVDTYPGRTV